LAEALTGLCLLFLSDLFLGRQQTLNIVTTSLGKAGKIRVLAHWGKEPLQSMPDVPSFDGLGIPIHFSQWSGIFVPSETPPLVINQLRQAAKQAAFDPKVQAAITSAGSPIQYLDAPEFAQFWAEDAKTLSRSRTPYRKSRLGRSMASRLRPRSNRLRQGLIRLTPRSNRLGLCLNMWPGYRTNFTQPRSLRSMTL